MEFLNASHIRAATFVRHVEIHDTLGSTNDRAAELARDTYTELPALIVARLQTAGRGRGGKTWWSADGALTFSLLLEPGALAIAPATWPQLSLATAVAVCDALAVVLHDNPKSEIRNPKLNLGIKWPNDVLIEGRKIAGILLESPGGAAPAKDRLIIGIGINVNNSWSNAPRDAAPNGTALCDISGRPHELQSVLGAVLVAIAGRINQLRLQDAALAQAWQDLNLLAGQSVTVEADGRRIQGECREIASDGALVVDSRQGLQRFYSGSIRDLSTRPFMT